MTIMLAEILIVDDDPDIVDLLQTALTGVGYSVRTAATGTQALASARRAPPDLVLLDLMLPDVNGFTVCEAFRRHAATVSVPIMLITGMPGEFPRLAGMEVGADAYVQKPIKVKELISEVENLLRRGRRTRDALVAA